MIWRPHLCWLLFLLCVSLESAAAANYSSEDGQKFIKTYCYACHIGKSPAGGFDATALSKPASFREKPDAWNAFLARVRNGEMPPKGAPAPSLEKRDAAVNWAHESLRAETCSAGITPAVRPFDA
jgi:mono/diheme cytochrome c family protein